MVDAFTILPATGIGQLPFGSTRDETRRVFGEPTEVISGEETDGEIWIYEEMAAALSFAGDHAFRLVSCESFHRAATLAGETLIGSAAAEAEASLRKLKIEEFETVRDEEGQTTQIAIPHVGVNLWVENGVVESIGWQVLLGEDEEPLWPEVLPLT
jgi:hypothetical protein